MLAKTTLIVVLLAVALYNIEAKQVCRTEDFLEFGCNPLISGSISLFGGKASAAKTGGTSPMAVYPTKNEDCEIGFGTCSTLDIDTDHSVLVAPDNSFEITITFTQKFRVFSVGKIYGGYPSNGVTFKFKKNGSVTLTDTVVQDPNGDCKVGGHASWEPPHGGFDQVVISGGVFGLTDMTACYNGASYFSGGDDDDESKVAARATAGVRSISYQEIQEGVCITCVDALGQSHYQMFVCDENNECSTETFSSADCTAISGTSTPVDLTITELQTLYPTPNSVCVLTSDVPDASAPAAKATARHSEL